MSNRRQLGALRRIVASTRPDDGVSIIEVLVAVLVFTLISIGIAQSLVTVIRLAGDQKHRVAALSLAAGEIDNARSYTSPFDIQSRTYTKPLDGVTYTIDRTVNWVDSTGNDISCGSGSGGSLFVLSVNVEVTWNGQERPLAPVASSTVIAPTGAINDASHSVLLLKVTGADGFGVPNVAVSLASSNATGTIPTPTKTDADGCSYAVGVPPGDYTVSIQKSGYVTLASQSVSTATALVGENAAHTYKFTAGQTKSIATFIGPVTNLSIGWLASGWSGSLTATNTKWPTTGTPLTAIPAGSDTVTPLTYSNPVGLYPSSSGYSIVYGTYVPPDITGAGGCKAPNAHYWGVEPLVATSGTATVGVGVAHVKIASPVQTAQTGTTPIASAPAKTTTLVATSTTGSGSDPGCSTGATMSFANLAAGDYDLVLPYGAWQITTTPSAQWCVTGSPVKCYKWIYTATVTGGTASTGTIPATVTGTKVDLSPPASF